MRNRPVSTAPFTTAAISVGIVIVMRDSCPVLGDKRGSQKPQTVHLVDEI